MKATPQAITLRESLYDKCELGSPAEQAPVEEGIQPVCDALNAICGVSAVWSCEGHSERNARPYIVFVAPQNVAFRLHQMLGGGRGDGRLKFAWCLKANFRDNGSFRYCIEPNDFRLARNWLWWPRKWSNRSMKKELIRLAKLISEGDFSATENKI